MFRRLFRKNPSLGAGDALFVAATEQARAEPFYTVYGVPDTVEGRFEMTALHVWLLVRRLKGGDDRAREVAQRLFDAMFDSFDTALRELGVGDLVIGKKVRKLAENFYGRVSAYEDGLRGAPDTLAAALARNLYESDDPASAEGVADYVRRAVAALDRQRLGDLAEGRAAFPAPEAGS